MPGHNPWRKVGDDVRGDCGVSAKTFWRDMVRKRCSHGKVKSDCAECNGCSHGRL